MKNKDRSRDRTRAYRERVARKQQSADEEAEERELYRTLNLCGFAETACDTPAQTRLEEIQVHRSWLRALGEQDVLVGETLRHLARRTWFALLNSRGLGVVTDGDGEWVEGKWVPGFDVWFPCFRPSQQNFQIPFDSARFPDGPLGERYRDAAKPEWFDKFWQPPGDCDGSEQIDVEQLPNLPPGRLFKSRTATKEVTK